MAENLSVSLFDGCVSSWRRSQKELVMWCAYYRNILSSNNVPPEKYFDNDIAFDRWLEINKFRQDSSPKHVASSHDNVFEVIE